VTEPLPLSGFRIGVTAARKVEEQVVLLERRGAAVEWAPALSLDPNRIDDDRLRAATEEVLSQPVDMFLATTGIGMKSWFDAAERWGLLPRLLGALGAAEILARGPKSVGALRRRGLRELWAPESECFEDVLEHLRGRSLDGRRIVVQEHGQSLSMVAHALRRRGADVTTVTVYRVASADDPEPMFKLVDLAAERALDAVTFTSAPAVAALMEAAGSTGRREDLVGAFQADVVAACVGPVTAAAFEMWGVPTMYPDRSRLAAMVKQLEAELPLRRSGLAIELAGGHQLLLHGESVLLDGHDVRLSPAPAAVLNALVANPGNVVSRQALLAMLPSGTAGSEHAVEMAVARLRAALGTRAVQTVVKRGYRLAVGT
jgi:uroporphyrinogen-III synthase